MTREQMGVAMNAIADQVGALCADHEREDNATHEHFNGRCPEYRMKAVVFLALRLGFTTFDGDPESIRSLGQGFLTLFRELESQQ